MTADAASAAIAKVGGPLEALGWLEESITFGRARWVLLDNEGRTASITLTLQQNGEPRVVVALEPEHGTDDKPVEFTSIAQRGLLSIGEPRMTFDAVVEFVLSYARLLAFRPSEHDIRDVPPGRLRQA